MPAGNLLHDGKAEASALAGGITRVAEAIENVIDFLLRNAHALVGDGDGWLLSSSVMASPWI